MYLKTPSFNNLQRFNMNLNQQKPFYKKDSLAHYLLFGTLKAYVFVLGAEQFQFPCSVIFDSFCSNWFKPVSAQPPIAKPSDKKNIVFSIIKILGPNISSSFNMMMSNALKDTRWQTYVLNRVEKNSAYGRQSISRPMRIVVGGELKPRKNICSGFHCYNVSGTWINCSFLDYLKITPSSCQITFLHIFPLKPLS